MKFLKPSHIKMFSKQKDNKIFIIFISFIKLIKFHHSIFFIHHVFKKKTLKPRGKVKKKSPQKARKTLHVFVYNFRPTSTKKSRSMFKQQQNRSSSFISTTTKSKKACAKQKSRERRLETQNESYKNRRSLENPFQCKRMKQNHP